MYEYQLVVASVSQFQSVHVMDLKKKEVFEEEM